MSRPTTKPELLAAGDAEFTKLWALIERIPEPLRQASEPVFDVGVRDRSVRDVLCHLQAWHELMVRWHDEGSRGERPVMPAPGYTWRTYPAMNQQIWADAQSIPYADASARVRAGFLEVRVIVELHSDEELFTKSLYPWTGTTSLGAYLVSATSSHYVWAQGIIRKFLTSL